MKCTNCGFYYEGARVCPNCGEVADGQADRVTDNTTRERPLGNPTPILVFGILSLAFALELPPLGVVFGIIALVKAGKYFAFVGYPGAGQARTGKGLAKAGVIVGAIMTVLIIVFIVLAILVFAPKAPERIEPIVIPALEEARIDEAKDHAADKVEEAKAALDALKAGSIEQAVDAWTDAVTKLEEAYGY